MFHRSRVLLFVATLLCAEAQAEDSMIWPLYRGNAQRTGVSPFKGPEKMRLRWEVQMTHEIASAPVVDEKGRLYLAAGADLWCVDAAGKLSWRHDFMKSRHADKFGGGHGAFVSASPGLSADGRLVQPVGSLFSVAHVLGFRTDAGEDQHLAWATKLSGVSRSSPLIVDGVSYIVIEGFVLACQSDGKIAWQTRGAFFLNSSPALSHDGTTIYIGGSDGNVHALERSSGRLKWKAGSRPDAGVRMAEKDANGRITRQFTTFGHVPECVAVAADGAIVFGSWNGFLTALESDGKVRWALDLKGRLTSAPAVTANGEMLIVSFEGTLFKVSAKGELIWQTEAQGRYSSPLVTADGRVLIGTQDGSLREYGLADGKLVSELKLLPNWGAITASPVPGGDGVIYLGGQDGVLRAIE